jgi:hypothetical protein
MKVVMNVLTNYQDKILQQGEIADIELKVAERWINMGLAHIPISEPALEPNEEKIPQEIIFREEPIKKQERKQDRKQRVKKIIKSK